jgi:uncharacterized membrane protein (UPF0127 family)
MRRPPPDPLLRLIVDGRAVAPLEVAVGALARARGLLGRDGIEGALLLRPAGSVHTFGMRFPIDVALCTRDLRVVRVRMLPPGRLTLPRREVHVVVEAAAGAFTAWGLDAGGQLRISGC